MLIAQVEREIAPASACSDSRRIIPGLGEVRLSRHESGCIIADRESVKVANPFPYGIMPGDAIGLVAHPECSDAMVRGRMAAQDEPRYLVAVVFGKPLRPAPGVCPTEVAPMVEAVYLPSEKQDLVWDHAPADVYTPKKPLK